MSLMGTEGFSFQNFAATIVSSQLNTQLMDDAGRPTPLSGTLDLLDLAFTVFFAAELAVNLFAHWLWPFLRSGAPSFSQRSEKRNLDIAKRK